MAATRRLTAILAADVAGYSRLMGDDEEGTHERLKAILIQIVDARVEEYLGRVVKNTGDGLLAEFSSVVEAVRCAVVIQRAIVDRNAGLLDERKLEFRMGINLGDVIVEDDDIFGEGVNVAARLEELAEPGGICVSSIVRDQVQDKLSYAFDDMGERAVKNIPRPLHAYSLSAAAIAALPDLPAAGDDVRPRVPPASRRRAPPAAGLSADPFVGRQDEIEVLTRAFEQARAGQGRIVLLAGEPGIGKTRTAQDLADHAARHGAAVLWGRCHEDAGAPPYWPWVQVVRASLRNADRRNARRVRRGGERHCGHRAGDPRSRAGAGAFGPPGRSGSGTLSHVRTRCGYSSRRCADAGRTSWCSMICIGPTPRRCACLNSSRRKCRTAGCC